MSVPYCPSIERLSNSLERELTHMRGDWFFKWHQIGGAVCVEIESFAGAPIRYSGIDFSGSARQVYWVTIQRYLIQKLESAFLHIEDGVKQSPMDFRMRVLEEGELVLVSFSSRIRKLAIDTDRVLRGNGFKFPAYEDLGQWHGSRNEDIRAKIADIAALHCELAIDYGGMHVSLKSLMKDQITLVKADGTKVRSNIPAVVNADKIITFATDLPFEVNDHILRELPNKLVEDFTIIDPVYYGGTSGIEASFQIKVRKNSIPAQSPQTIIANLHGSQSRININSIDQSVTISGEISTEKVLSLVAEVQRNLMHFPQCNDEIAEILALLKEEANRSSPSPNRIKDGLNSLKAIAEGMTGNLLASGVIALISKIAS